MKSIQVSIIVGSDSDLPVINSCVSILKDFSISYSINVASAHRSPNKLLKIIKDSENNGVNVFITAAGMSAALPGVVASQTICPVIGIPLENKSMPGLDALFSIVQMPPGVPVATVAIGKAGAINAGLLAVEILSLKDSVLKEKLLKYRDKLASDIEKKDEKLNQVGIDEYIKTIK